MVNRQDTQYDGEDRVDFLKEFDQMFPMPAQKREDVEGYLNYKQSYVKHLLFSSDAQSLSEFIIFS